MAAMDTACAPAHSPLLAALIEHAQVVRDYWSMETVPRIHVSQITREDFLRDYVANNRPVVLLGAIDHWPAIQQWRDLDAFARAGKGAVTCSITPNGRADAVTSAGDSEVFSKPSNVTMPFADCIDLIRRECTFARDRSPAACVHCVPYLSYQNDSLRQQSPELLSSIGDVLIAGPALASGDTGGRIPRQEPPVQQPSWTWAEAVNLWVGTPRAVSSCHKDHYENLYSVVRGRKVFTLCPPCDVMWLAERVYKGATWRHVRDGGACGCGLAGTVAQAEQADGHGDALPHGWAPCWQLLLDPPDGEGACPTVPWISVDPSLPPPAQGKYPLAKYASPVSVTVEAGETLYLPSLWYHRVAQPGVAHRRGQPDDDVTIAVNAWFNMAFVGQGWANYQLARAIAPLL